MLLALGLISFGAAKFLARVRGGMILIVPGAFIGVYVRPNELLLIVAGFVVAMMVPTAGRRKTFSAVRRLVALVFLGGLLFLAVTVTVKYLHHGLNTNSLQTTNANNAETGFSGGIPYSANIATYPRDFYEVLFNPLLFNAHGFGERVAALENTLIVVLILASIRNLRMVPRASFARPYVMLCLVYTGAFIYTFAALGNLGLIERERVLVLPFMLVLLCIPRSARGRPARYDWELRRGDRLRRRAMLEYRNRQRRPVAPAPAPTPKPADPRGRPGARDAYSSKE
jgi:hypothetical protein